MLHEHRHSIRVSVNSRTMESAQANTVVLRLHVRAMLQEHRQYIQVPGPPLSEMMVTPRSKFDLGDTNLT